MQITDIKSLGNDRFEVFFDSSDKSQIIKYETHQIEDDLAMPFIVPEDEKFFDVWNSDVNLRRKLSAMLQEKVTAV